MRIPLPLCISQMFFMPLSPLSLFILWKLKTMVALLLILRVTDESAEERIRNEHVRRMFYGIPHVDNMIAAHQLDFLGKTARGQHYRPAQQMPTSCCDIVRQIERPFLHNKDYIVKNQRTFQSSRHLAPRTGRTSAFGLRAGGRRHNGSLFSLLLSQRQEHIIDRAHPGVRVRVLYIRA